MKPQTTRISDTIPISRVQVETLATVFTMSSDETAYASVATGLEVLTTPYLLTVTLAKPWTLNQWLYTVTQWKLHVPDELPESTQLSDQELNVTFTSSQGPSREGTSLARTNALAMTGGSTQVPDFSDQAKAYSRRVGRYLQENAEWVEDAHPRLPVAEMKIGMYNCLVSMPNQDRNRDRRNLKVLILDQQEYCQLLTKNTSTMYTKLS